MFRKQDRTGLDSQDMDKETRMSIGEREDQLFTEWSEGRASFFKDGVVNEQRFVVSPVKVLFLMKEPNSQEQFGDLRDYFRAPGLASTSNNLARWAHGIASLHKAIPWEVVSNVAFEQRREWLSSVCIVNVKKSAGGGASRYSEIVGAMEADAHFLRRQISIYQSDLDLIICCGRPTDGLALVERTTWRKTARGVPFYEFDNSKFVIAWCHPQARYPRNLLFYELMEAAREVLCRSAKAAQYHGAGAFWT